MENIFEKFRSPAVALRASANGWARFGSISELTIIVSYCGEPTINKEKEKHEKRKEKN
jgi:hypothetical protein